MRVLAPDVKLHPEYNLVNLLDYANTFAEPNAAKTLTNYKYTIGALLCKLVMDKSGTDGLYRLLSSGRSDAELYGTLEILLKVKRTDFNRYLRQEIDKYATP